MKVAYVSDSFARRERFGLSRYAHELYRSLSAKKILVIPTSPCNAFSAPWPEWLQHAGFKQLPIMRPVLASLWSVAPYPRIESWVGPVDIVHSIDVDYQVRAKAPWVVSFHDLGPLTQPQFFSKAHPWLLRNCVSAAVRRADALICVSQATAQELSDIAGTPLGDRLVVIHEGAAQEFFHKGSSLALKGLKQSPTPGVPYFLFTGSMNPRKNLSRVVRAFASIASTIPHQLVLTGSLGWDAEEFALELRRSSAAGRVVLPGYVSDEQLRALYAGSEGFVFPSLYEGFGLPILEAMASGCPVITSKLSSMPEVAGDAAILIDPTNEMEIAEAMLSLAQTPQLRCELVAKGYHRAAMFSWERCADQTIQVYQGLIR